MCFITLLFDMLCDLVKRYMRSSLVVFYLQDYADLIAVFCNAQQHPELRMAIFAVLLNCEPNFFVLQALTKCAAGEELSQGSGPRSNQVASFVISHLSALAYHDNVLTKTR